MYKKNTYLPVQTEFSSYDNCKMLLSMEGYDSLYGGPRPNGSSKSWYFKEKGRIEPPTNLGHWNFFDEYGKWFDNKTLRSQHQPHVIDQHHCHYKYKEELVGQEHLYVITVFNPHYFKQNREIGFSVIDEQYQKDVREGRAYIILFYPWEGYSGMEGNSDFIIVEEWRKKAKFPPKSVHFVTGNLTADYHEHNKHGNIVFHTLSTFDNWNSDTADIPPVTFEPDEDKYLYLTYNRNPRKNRVYLGCKLMEHDLLDKGLISLGKPEWLNSGNVLRQDGVRDKEWSDLTRKLPLELGKNLHFNLACNVTHEDYTKTFCSIVTETLIEDGTVFLSEKTWKCFQVGHPFFLLGNKHTLKYLRNQGYQTFNEWWDESYDDVNDYRLRVNSIIREVERFSKYSKEDLKIIRNEMDDVLKWNKKHHYEGLVSRWGFHQTEKPLWVLDKFHSLYIELVNRNKNVLI
jgi:hypothetical protein